MIYAKEGMISDDDALFCALEIASHLDSTVGGMPNQFVFWIYLLFLFPYSIQYMPVEEKP